MAYSRTLNHFTSMQELATIWASSTSYLVNQPVIHNNFLYRCAVAHTSSGSFQTDLAAGNWERVSSAENAINWASGAYYVLNQLVIDNDKLYKCLVAHTSGGSFIADLQSAYWVEISASEAGVFNYIENADAEVDTLGWSTYADAAGAQPVDGTGGSPNITFTRSTSSPLRGDASFNLAKDAVNRQGEGVAYDFTVDNADLAKVLTIAFDYEVVSGTYANGDLTIYLIQDPSGTPLVIQPAGYVIQAGTVGTKLKAIATFQTASNVNDYRLCFHVASTSASAYTLAIDNVVVGPQVVQYGAPVTDWQEYTPTGTWTNNTTYTGEYRRVGDSLEVRALVAVSGGAPNATILRVNLPAGLSIDTTKLATSVAEFTVLGTGGLNDSSTTAHKAYVVYISATSVGLRYQSAATSSTSASSQVSYNAPFAFNTGDSVNLQFSVPILGWSSTVQMSNDTDTRVVAAKIRRTAGQAVAGTIATVVQWNQAEFDTHGSFNTGTYTYTVPVAGIYEISGQYVYNGIPAAAGYDANIRLYLNGADADIQTAANTGTVSQTQIQRFLFRKNLVAGDTIAIRAYHSVGAGLTILGDSTALGLSALHIVRLSGPSAIAASETVAARYTTAAAQFIPNTAVATTVNFNTKDYDTHGAVTTGTSWIFTVPISGKYLINAAIRYQTLAWNGTNAAFSVLYVNGAASVSIGDCPIWNTLTDEVWINGQTTLQLSAGDTIQYRTANSRTSGNAALLANANYNYIDIVRIGN